MTTFELTWHPDQNRAPADESSVAAQSKWLLWYLASFILGNIGGATTGIWTCEGSSDGATAGMDGTNRWGAAFDSSKIVRGSGVSARSWIVCKSPVGLGPWYVLFDYNTSNDYSINVTFSKSAFSGGSTTTLPTASNSWSYTSLQMVPVTIAPHRVFSRLSTTGQWHIHFSTTSSGRYTFGLSFFTLVETKVGDTHNGWSYGEYNAANGAWSIGSTRGASNTFLRGRSKDGTVAVFAKIPRETDGSATDALDEVGNVDAVDGAVNESPAYLYVYTVGHKSKRGRLVDVMQAPSTAVAPTVEPLTGPPYESHVVTAFWFPYLASATPTL